MSQIYTRQAKKQNELEHQRPPFNVNQRWSYKPTSPQGLANAQMDFFHDKNQKLMEEIQDPPDIDPLEILQNCFNKWNAAGYSAPRMELQEVSLGCTAKLISKLGNSSTMGFDDLDAQVIKLASSNLLKPINHLIKHFHKKQEFFPTKWKLGRIIPLHKGKSLPATLLVATDQLLYYL